MQAVRRRLISAAVVLTVGTVSAIPFYRVSPQPDSTKKSTSSDSQTTSPNKSATLQIPGGESSLVAASGEDPRFVTTAAKNDNAKPGDAETRRNQSLPSPQLTNRRPAAQEAVPPAAQIRRMDNNLLSPTAGEPQSQSKTPTLRSHWIADGDTLEELAQRFLGDRSRWREIREANRDVLTTDDILPIGKEIRIPPREVRSSQASNPSAVESRGLVPIPWHEE